MAVITGTSGNDSRSGTGTADTLSGLDGNDRLDALGGHDSADGGAGNDTLLGGDGDDTLFGGSGGDVFSGGAGNDSIDGGLLYRAITPLDAADLDTLDYRLATRAVTVNFALGTGLGLDIGTDRFVNVEQVFGGSGNDTFVGGTAAGARFHYYRGGAGNDSIQGGAYTDQADYTDATGGIAVDMGAGIVTGAGIGTDTLRSVEQVSGSDFADLYDATAFTGAGATTPSLNAGNAGINGASSDYNRFRGGAGDDTIIGNGATTIDYSNAAAGEAVFVSFVNGEAIGGASVGSDVFSGVEGVRGSSGNDTLLGGLSVSNDFEVFEGRGGNDSIDGGQGFDEVRYSGDGLITKGITVSLAAGIVTGDAVLTGTDTLRGIESVLGSLLADHYDATGFGAGGANVGNNRGFNRFEGLAGNDTIVGNGDTEAWYNRAQEAVKVNLGAGAAVGGASVGSDALSGVWSVRGTDFADKLTGGGAGRDRPGNHYEKLEGGGGNDTIDGGAGVDIATYQRATGAVTVNLATGVATGNATVGTDKLANIEWVIGSAYADKLTGGSAAAPFEMFSGNDGKDTIDGGAGFDWVNYSDDPAAVSVNLATGTARDGYGKLDKLIGIEAVEGSSYADNLIGDKNDNGFRGMNGADTINGGAGKDTVYYDRQTVAITADLVIGFVVDAGGSPDRLIGIENLVATDFNDRMSGDAGANALTGLDGNDSMGGMNGSDTLDGGAGFDWASYGASTAGTVVNLATGVATDGTGGTDKLIGIEAVRGSVYADAITGSGVANELRGGDGNDSLLGAAGADSLFGDGGTDSLNGGNDADLLFGGAGNDTIVTGTGADLILFGATPGTDRITDFGAAAGANNDKLGFILSAFPGLTIAGAAVFANANAGGVAPTASGEFWGDTVAALQAKNLSATDVLVIRDQAFATSDAALTAVNAGAGANVDTNGILLVYRTAADSFRLAYDSNGAQSGGETVLAALGGVTDANVAGLINTDFVFWSLQG